MSNVVRWVLCAAIALAAPVVQAEVSVDGRPRVLVLFDEKVMGVLGTTGWEVPNQTELTLIKHLGDELALGDSREDRVDFGTFFFLVDHAAR